MAIILEPCKLINPGDCEVMYQGAPTSTLDSVGPISDYFQDYVLEVSYIEDTADLKNFEQPLQRNLVSNLKLRFDSKSQTWVRYEFSQIEVESKVGFWQKSSTTVSGLQFRTSFFTPVERDPLYEQQILLDGQR